MATETAFWATEVLPLFATAFVVVGLEILALAGDGGLADELTQVLDLFGFGVTLDTTVPPMRAATFLEPLANDIIILFLGAFLLAAAVRKHGIDDRLASRLLRPFARSPLRLLYGVLNQAGYTVTFLTWMLVAVPLAAILLLAAGACSM